MEINQISTELERRGENLEQMAVDLQQKDVELQQYRRRQDTIQVCTVTGVHINIMQFDNYFAMWLLRDIQGIVYVIHILPVGHYVYYYTVPMGGGAGPAGQVLAGPLFCLINYS